MINILSSVRRMPKRVGVVAALVAAAVVPTMIVAWGPDRPTFTVANPADYVTFNSITDNPNYGDERNFVTIKDASNTSAGGWEDEVDVQPGKEYLVRTYVHNNAKESLNLVAQNTRVKASIPATTGKSVEINGFISADNAQPKQVWDQARLVSDKNFNVAFVEGSAKIYTNKMTSGTTLSDSIVTSAGAQIGYDKLDGKVPGCFEYTSIVTYKVKVQVQEDADFDIEKEVRESGSGDKYGELATVKPGAKVDFRINFKNTGDAKLNNVVIKDQLPEGMSYVPGTAKLYNSNYPTGYDLGNSLFNDGANIGHYSKGINAIIGFQAKIADNDKLKVCGNNSLRNIASVETDAGGKSDDARVNVTKECEEPEEPAKPTYVCVDLDVIEKDDKYDYGFEAVTRTSGGAVAHEVKYDFGDNQTATVDYGVAVDHTYAAPGTYNITAQVSYKVDGKTVVVEPTEACTAQVTIPETPTTPETPVTPGNPEVPGEIPATGPAVIFGGLFGSSALGYGIYSWLASRRVLRGSLNQ